MLTLFQKANEHRSRQAIISNGISYSYETLLNASGQLAMVLLNNQHTLNGARVAFMVAPGFEYVKAQWGIWQAGGVAVPLCLSNPLPALSYVIDDTAPTILVVSSQYEKLLTGLAAEKNIRLIVIGNEATSQSVPSPGFNNDTNAMILYTSGTTNKPKGVIITHANLEAQITALIEAWKWNNADHIICVLPLHHVHGIVNVVCCALWAGATCEFIPEFSAEAVFGLFEKGKINVFMAVPTVYFKLIAYWETLSNKKQEALTAHLKKFRLMVCGSAALPVSVMEKWKVISGHTLLERYGMTEIGMAISNPYHGERRAGYVGLPLPGVTVKLVNEHQEEVEPGTPGEILVKGKNVFNAYWQNPEATADAFLANEWFKTGDVAVTENGYYRIMGRNSIDIIKSGGYKISALEIEEELRKFESIADCAVVGIPDEEWGELIVAAIVIKTQIDTHELNGWFKERMATYKMPRKYLIVDELPRNTMGKVTKNEVKKLFV